MTAFIFVPLLAATVFVAAAFWCYSSHSFIVIAEETAAGNEILHWDDEPIYDWLWQGGYLAWLIGVWLVPAVLLARIVSDGIDERWRWYAALTVGFAIFWVSFPLSLLSSMAAESRMALFHAGLLRRLANRSGDVLVFYVCTGLMVTLAVPLVPLLVEGEGIASLLGGAVLLGLAFIIYARMMGRLACLARLTRIRPRKAAKKAKRARNVAVTDPWEVPDEVQREDDARGVGFVQPSEMPTVHSPYEGEISGYDVRFDNGPAEVVRPATNLQEPERFIDADDQVAGEVSNLAKKMAAAIEPDKLEMQRLKRKKETIPTRPWGSGIWLFPLQTAAAAQWGLISLGIGFLALMVRALIMLWPWR